MRRPTGTSRLGRYLGRWSIIRHHRERRVRATAARRWTVRSLIVVLVLAVIPVPWLHVIDDDPPGWAWRLDGRLVVDGQIMDPAGEWSWLTVGRPPLLIEAARDSLVGSEDPARDMRVGPVGSNPAQTEPLAAAVGLQHAGAELHLGVFVEVARPQVADLPDRAVIVQIDGRHLRSRADVAAALRESGGTLQVVTASGRELELPGPGLPYDRVRVIDLAPQGFTAAIGGPFSRLAPVAWFRSLSLGNSHGMMVALMTYAHVANPDIARGRHIAGTGTIRGDGTIGRIGGLPAKAHAAQRAGADVLLYPADQSAELVGFTPLHMDLAPVATLAEAIAYLDGDDAGELVAGAS